MMSGELEDSRLAALPMPLAEFEDRVTGLTIRIMAAESIFGVLAGFVIRVVPEQLQCELFAELRNSVFASATTADPARADRLALETRSALPS
jgi:hypothetical protein